MQAEDLIQGYIDAICANPRATDDEVVEAILARATEEIDRADVVAAMHFTQIAFGRFILEGEDFDFPEEYVRMRPEGEIYERGFVASQPMYVAARRLATTPAAQSAFAVIAARSAEIDLFNKGQQTRGGDPTKRRTSPLVVIDSDPTPEGMEVVRAFLEDELRFWGPVN